MNPATPDDQDTPLDAAEELATEERRFPCSQCGAKLVFAPEVARLKCEHCGCENEIPASGAAIEEQDYHAYLDDLVETAEVRQATTFKCTACAAEIERPAHVTAGACPFCGTDVVAADSRELIQPQALLPFHVARAAAEQSFHNWLAGLWFAPGELKKLGRQDDRLRGVYVPYWTYDCRTTTHYTGQRGDDYWETQTYTAHEGGRNVTRTRQVRKTRWRSVAGTVRNAFDDLLVMASRSLPTKYAERLEPWDLDNLHPYTEEYLSGFGAESYQVDLPGGFEVAKTMMDGEIRATICGDIGGDHQRIHSMEVRYQNITFKHILLPVWISAYRYRNQVYRFLVNARTGEVQGERPWSWVKITLTVLAGLATVAAVVAILSQR